MDNLNRALELAEEDGCACIWRSGIDQDEQSEHCRFDVTADDLRAAIIQEPAVTQRGLWIEIYVLSEYSGSIPAGILNLMKRFLAEQGPIELFLQRMVDSRYWLCHVRQCPAGKAFRCLQTVGADLAAQYEQRPYRHLNWAALEKQIENQ
ncbi:MAG: hypothetical protein WAO58_06870 [Fimbriimonadaceae bacterium]